MRASDSYASSRRPVTSFAAVGAEHVAAGCGRAPLTPPGPQPPSTTDRIDSETESFETKTYSRRAQVSESAAENSSTSTVLTFPEPLSGATLSYARKLLEHCPVSRRQAVLDEVGLTHCKGLLRNPIGCLYRLVQRARTGEFFPSRTSGSAGAARRRRPNGELSTSTSDGMPLEAATIAARVVAKFRDPL